MSLCQQLALEKLELVPKQVFDFVGYKYDLTSGKVCRTSDRWETLSGKNLLASPQCTIRQLMSLIGLLMATEKQVHLGRLHMQPIQWHIKQHWRVPESLLKVIPIPLSLHPHLKRWLKEENVRSGEPLHPLDHSLQILTDASQEGWGAQPHRTGFLVYPREHLHINFLELKAVFLALKEF